MNEIWKEIEGFKDYEVSNLGRVKSLKCNKERFLKPNSGKSSGYLKVNLYKNTKMKTRRIHQLIAIAFLNHNPDGYKLVVAHINNVKTDNRLENLQLITHRENISKDTKGLNKYTGVSWSKLNKNWIARIRINGKNKNLGRFTNELKASEAYQKALKELIK
tara:strand:+ start:127 stop:609 length:483 start_codon:yes stop_codon:yes gene_type:complete